MIEELDDILEELANKMGIYEELTHGAHNQWQGAREMTYHCRLCFMAYMKARLIAAVERCR